jgi:phosphoglycolate phosphatase-like HAD superfamily hydrolase
MSDPERAGIDASGVVLATSDDAPTRTGIMDLAHRRACAEYDVPSFDAITSVGDAVWDVKAARDVGYRFIGIGCRDNAARLRQAGAELVFDDFTGGFLEALRGE